MTRLNHFILWCKGWYKSINPDMDIFDEAVVALRLDNYFCCGRNNVIGIVTKYIDELIDKDVFDGRPGYLRFTTWNQNISRNIHWYKVSYDEAVLIVLKNFFAYHIDKGIFQLNPPTYSRRLFKMGFVAPRHFGNSYKMCNHKAKKFFEKERVLE